MLCVKYVVFGGPWQLDRGRQRWYKKKLSLIDTLCAEYVQTSTKAIKDSSRFIVQPQNCHFLKSVFLQLFPTCALNWSFLGLKVKGLGPSHVLAPEKEGYSPREVLVGIYIHKTLWEVILS